MPDRIGLLLPRSTDYPAIAYDLMDGLRFALSHTGYTDYTLHFENIGFGEDVAGNHAKAEKLLMGDDVKILIAYCSSANAEHLYQVADGLGKPIIFLDPGMQHPELAPSRFCYHISLQGIQACYHTGYLAGTSNRRVMAATSFYDGGYRGPWYNDRGLSAAGGSVCANFVSGYRVADFTIQPYLSQLQQTAPDAVTACFSSYLAELFFKELKEHKENAVAVPFYCSPYMAEEQILGKCDFPGGSFTATVPWATSLENDQQETFTSVIHKEKNKQSNIFHLLGWEAATAAAHLMRNGVDSMNGFQYQSPRGTVTFHPETNYTYAPLYAAEIIGDSSGKCVLKTNAVVDVSAADHLDIITKRPAGAISGWRNNYFCI